MRRVVVLIAVGLLMGACAGGSAGKDQSVPLPPSNATDVEFLTGMIPHPFLVVLFFFYAHLERLLPANF